MPSFYSVQLLACKTEPPPLPLYRHPADAPRSRTIQGIMPPKRIAAAGAAAAASGRSGGAGTRVTAASGAHTVVLDTILEALGMSAGCLLRPQ